MGIQEELGTMLEAKVTLELAQSSTQEGRAELGSVAPLLPKQGEIIDATHNLAHDLTKRLEEIQKDLGRLMTLFADGARTTQNIQTYSAKASQALQNAKNLTETACNSVTTVLGEQPYSEQLLETTATAHLNSVVMTTRSDEAAKELEVTQEEVGKILRTVIEVSGLMTAIRDEVPTMRLTTDAPEDNPQSTLGILDCDSAAEAFGTALTTIEGKITTL